MMDTLKMHSLDGVQRNIELIGKLFPNAITEVKRDGKVEHAIDFDVLRQELSDSIVEGREERYQFTWPDKKKAMLAANAPITATLRPVVADSVGKDGTPGGFDSENLYIEGDNLEVLKLLQETYLGKVKMIYIDPPYNTGNDFVYEDDFAQRTEDYMENSGQYDEEGNRMVTNTESNGRFHTDWLNMIYPRLKIAKDLLLLMIMSVIILKRFARKFSAQIIMWQHFRGVSERQNPMFLLAYHKIMNGLCVLQNPTNFLQE